MSSKYIPVCKIPESLAALSLVTDSSGSVSREVMDAFLESLGSDSKERAREIRQGPEEISCAQKSKC
jgi:hypothetical protein